ncbi:MAG: hypothetical protein WB587_06050, partial [Nitrososphaeraceae archaeon]
LVVLASGRNLWRHDHSITLSPTFCLPDHQTYYGNDHQISILKASKTLVQTASNNATRSCMV